MSRPLRLLIVEDSRDDMLLVLYALRSGGIEPEYQRVDTEAAMERLLQGQEWDAVLSDFKMPQFNALEALEVYKRSGKDIPFLIVSGKIPEETAVAAMKAGAHDWISKERLARLAPALLREIEEAHVRRDRKAKAEALEKAYQQNQLLLNSVGEGICGLDRENHIIFVNPAACEMTGYLMEGMLGQDFFDLVGPGTEASPVTSSTVVQGQDFYRRKDGTSFPVDYMASPILEDGVLKGRVLSFRDVSERFALEQMKNRFLTMVSHELRTPLSSTHGSLRYVANMAATEMSPKTRFYMEVALRNIRRLSHVVHDILDLERLQSGTRVLHPQTFDADDLIKQAIDLMQPLAMEAGVTLELLPSGLQAWGDPDRVLQVLTNLLHNAIVFSGERTVTKAKAEVRGQDVCFMVTDQGCGIPEDQLESIFEPFESGKAAAFKAKGSGLGLAISRSIVEQHGGGIWAESTLGSGSTFYFTLPFHSNAETWR